MVLLFGNYLTIEAYNRQVESDDLKLIMYFQESCFFLIMGYRLQMRMVRSVLRVRIVRIMSLLRSELFNQPSLFVKRSQVSK
uniref:Putative ovule protein n=1 Tax=Solanum chacoense TaxID=4108 RepID=A0A0V0HS81_SOLCH